MKRLGLFILFSLFALLNLKAQDTIVPSQDLPKPVEIRRNHNPRTATWLSLIPGAGQAYNRKFWKMPIVYAGFGVGIYFAVTNNDDYKLYRMAYDYKTGVISDASEKAKEEAAKYSEANLISLRDYYRRNMELSWIITAAWYVVQIIDANVDAHFFYYEIGDDLTLKVEPQLNTSYDYNSSNLGLSLKLNF